jgi:hypothetical protein
MVNVRVAVGVEGTFDIVWRVCLFYVGAAEEHFSAELSVLD